MTEPERASEDLPPRPWLKLLAPAIATLLILATLLPSIGRFHHFLIVVTEAILPVALLTSGIRGRSVAVERAGWAWFGLNCVLFLMIILG